MRGLGSCLFERNRDAWVGLMFIWEKSWCVGWLIFTWHHETKLWSEIMRRCECSCVLYDGKRDALVWPWGSCFFMIEIVMRCVDSRFYMTEIRAHVLHSRNRDARCWLAFYMTEIVISCVGSRAPWFLSKEQDDVSTRKRFGFFAQLSSGCHFLQARVKLVNS
jgi:hypothetical protein